MENAEKKKIKINKKKIIVLSVIILTLIIFCIWQNNYLQKSYYIYESPKISEDLDGYKIVQISDLHNKSFGSDQSRLLDKIREYEPDMIAVTGDLIDSTFTDVEKAMTFIGGAVEIAPTYFITGNHELWVDYEVKEDLISQLENAGVICLIDESIVIEHEGTKFNLIGLDDNSLFGSTLQAEMEELDTDLFTLLLAHEPQYLKNYSESDVDLVLSGHAHGGQFILPFIGGLVAPGQGFNPEYYEGEHVQNGTTMIISRGLGNSVIPLRLFNFPEIVFIELKHV